MKTVCNKLLSLTLVALLLVSAVPFQALATEGETTAPVVETEAAVIETEAAVVETEAAVIETEAAVVTEPTAETESVVVGEAVSDAAAAAVGDKINVVFTLKEYPQANILTLTNMKIGYKVDKYPSSSDVLKSYAQYAGTSTGKTFSHWELSDGSEFNPKSVNVTDTIVTPGSTLYIYAVLGPSVQYAKIDAKSGVVSTKNHPVVVNETYNFIQDLPVPTREHYEFQYWYKLNNKTEIPVYNDSIVSGADVLYAKWNLTTYNVTFQRYTGSEWATVKTVPVTALSTMTTSNGFPSDSEIISDFALSGFTIKGWEIGESDNYFTAGKTKVEGDLILRPRYQGSVTLMANNPDSYTSNTTKSVAVEIGEPIPTLPNPGARDGYTFVDWTTADYTTVISTKENLSNTAVHPLYYPTLGNTFYARWTESSVVYLYIHTDNNTQTATTVVPYYEAPSSGAFDTRLINMYSIFSNYGHYDDNTDVAYGWFSASQWKNYCANTAANAATTFYDIGTNKDYRELHIMLINNGGSANNNNFNNNNYNNNSSTADPSNPTTGDNIPVAVGVMSVSAAALAVLFFLKKRQAI